MKISELIEQFGLENLGMPYVRHIQGKIWEMRAKGRSGISRALYVAVIGRRIVILRVFVKKTPQTPPTEIALALVRLKEINNG
jgi:phage-related protein